MAQNGVIPLAAFNTSVHYPFAVVQSLSHVHSLRSHRLQHAWPPCPSLSPRVHSNSCPLGRWCHPTISSSTIPFSCPQSFPALGSFLMSQLFSSGGPSIEASASVLPVNIQGWFPLGLTGLISLQSKGLSKESSPTPQFESINSSVLSLLYGPALTSIHDYWKHLSFWLDGPWSAKWCLCFLICCLGLS